MSNLVKKPLAQTRFSESVRLASHIAVALMLASCASMESQEQTLSTSAAALSAEQGAGNRGVAGPAENDPTSEPMREEPTIMRGSDQSVALPEQRERVRLDGEAVMLNFEQAPLADIVHSILGETLGLDYVIEHPVKGQITLRTRSPIPRGELLPILESLLRNNNVVMIRGPNDRYFISGSPSMRSTVPRFASAPEGGYSNVIVPLQYIGAAEMAEILKPVAREDTFVRIDNSRNLLILAGTTLQLDGWMNIVNTFDVDQLAGMSVGIFPLTNATVQDLSIELEHILGTTEGASGIAGMVRLMPVERLNSILVVSPRAHYIDEVGRWIEELDGAGDLTSEPTLHVYSVRNTDSSQLSSLLSSIYGGSGGGGSKPKSQQGVAPGMSSSSSGEGGASMSSGNSGGVGTINLGDDVRVVSDEYNNSLLVYAAPQEYRRIEAILRRLDVTPTQVLIEASIIEVTLTDDLKYGLEWTFSNNLGGGDTGTGSLNLGDGGIGPKAPGFSYTISNTAGVKAALNALATDSLVNVISTPSVMVLDNHMATINVGQQQPIQSSSTVTNGGNVQNSITYKQTGVQLQVTPSVNDGGMVTMTVDQSVTVVGLVDAATGQRSFLERALTSKVAVRSGESVVLGGLISNNASTGTSGVPVLKDIPVLGSLFSSTSTTSARTELLVFLTPRVLEGDEDLRDISLEMRQRMTGLTNFEDLPQQIQPPSAGTTE